MLQVCTPCDSAVSMQGVAVRQINLNLDNYVPAPIIWIELPTTLKSCESLASFYKNLKTYLAFPPSIIDGPLN